MDLSLAEARRIALAAQGFGGRRPPKPGLTHVRQVAARIHAIQIDSVNVLVRSHYLPAYSRLGPYPIEALDTLAYRRRELFECWGHAACFMPVELYPVLRYRMTALRASTPWSPGVPTADDTYLASVYGEVAERGPLTARELSEAGASRGRWWGWSRGKEALEHLLGCGMLAVAARQGFTRVYDITERVIPADVLRAAAPGPEEAQKQLICLAAAAQGVTGREQLGGYFGLHSHRVAVRGPNGKRRRPIWRGLVDELLEEGRLVSVAVEGWQEPGYAVPGTRVPRSMQARALLSPFDSFMRGSARNCCGFVQSLAQQLYVPAERRVYGYYVLPFLLGDNLVGRCDLKADRTRGVLIVQAAHVEPGQDDLRVGGELAEELEEMRRWLQLDAIEVADRGDLAPALRAAVPPAAVIST